jgi:hypothetical protein
VADCLGSDSAMRNYVVQLGVPICGTQMLAWVLLLGTFIIDSIHLL